MTKKTKQKTYPSQETKYRKKYNAQYKKNYYTDKKVIAVIISKEEAEGWKHDLALGPLARQLMRAYFAGKIQIDL